MAEHETNASSILPEAAPWIVRELRGRRSGPEKGLAAVHSMTAQRADGAEFIIGRLDSNDQQAVQLDIIAFAGPMTFDRCPICLEPGPTSKEHVPPAGIGGSVMTSTCQQCNNQFGSVLESDLIHWWEDAIGSVSFSHEDVAGPRRTSPILMRQKDTGEPVLVLRRGLDPAIRSRMVPGEHIEMTCFSPDRHRYRLAALKSAYLGAFLLLRSIPETPEAKAVRAELTAVRDLPRKQRPEISELCASLRIRRSTGPSVPGEIALVQAQPSDGSAPEIAISLARTLLVTWPVGGYLVGVDAEGNPAAVLAL